MVNIPAYLPAAALAAMTKAEIRGLSTADIASLNVSALNTLPDNLLQALSVDQIATISPATLSALDPTAFGHLLRNQIASLTLGQIASLTTTEVGTLSKGKLARLSAAQIAQVDPLELASLGARRIGSLSETQIDGLTKLQLDSLNIREVNALAAEAIVIPGWGSHQVNLIQASTISSMSVKSFEQLIADNVDYLSSLSGINVAEFQSLTSTQFANIETTQFNSIDGAILSQLNPANFTTSQMYSLSSTQISSLTTTFFNLLPPANLAVISPSYIANLSLPDLLSLNSTQLSSLTNTQLSAMTSDQLDVVLNTYNPLTTQALALQTDGVLSIDGAITLLDNVAVGGNDPLKFQELLALGNNLQVPNNSSSNDDFILSDYSIITTEAVKNLYNNVVFGNFENYTFNGGNSYIIELGNLSDSTPVYDFDMLIGKWFSGADLPTLQTDISGTKLITTYTQNTSSLYDATGIPTLTDVIEGTLDDSALLAGVAETALQDPNYIEQLITNNGNGTYEVEMPNMFGPSFVTVNNELPVPVNGQGMATATNAVGLWVGLLEKAAAQNAANSSIIHGDFNNPSLGNSYAALTVNPDDQIMLYSGQYYNSVSFIGGETSRAMSDDLTSAQVSFDAGNNVILEDHNHFFAVTDIDIVNGLVSTYDPFGGRRGTFSLASMANNVDIIYFGVSSRAAV